MNFVTIDFKTLQYAEESVYSVGLVKYQNGKEVDSYYSLIRPPDSYLYLRTGFPSLLSRPDFTDILGFTIEDLKNAPNFTDIWDSSIKPFIGDLPLAVHGAFLGTFELWYLLELYELPIPHLPLFCTLVLARRVWPELESQSLSDLAEKLDIVYNIHNALDAAKTCGKLVLMAADKFGSASLAELLLKTKVEMR
ncbi:exonuclease [Spirochaetia bacterium]|nr:exonuclease [Spirochaetia bacterium]